MTLPFRHFFLGILGLLASGPAHAVTIDAVYFGQTHVMKATQAYFTLVGERNTLIKVHVTDSAKPASPSVSVTLSLNSQTLTLPLSGPPTLPVSIPDGPGVVQHSLANSFTATLPAAWIKTGLTLTVNAGAVQSSVINVSVGAPSMLTMNMTDVHFFAAASGDYPTGTLEEVEAKLPVSDLDVRRSGRVIFSELVMTPPGTRPAVRIKSKDDYLTQTGFIFDGEQDAASAWNKAIRRAAGRSGAHSLYYTNIYGVHAGGQAGSFTGVGNGTSEYVLFHELGHALSLPHWVDSAEYPYKGDMNGIQAPATYLTHAGPTWAFDGRTNTFIRPTRLVSGVPTYKVDPMEGGGTGDQEPPFLLNHFSDYSVNQMRSYLQSTLVVWNPTLGGSGAYAKWNQATGQYSSTQTNNGVQFPTIRDTQVITIMASVSGASPEVNMVYPPIGPYTAGLIRLFDPNVAADRTAANSIFSPSTGSDVCVRVVQGGVQKTYMLAASMVTTDDPNSAGSLVTEAINLPAADGAVTRLELLATPDVEDVGLPANPQVLYTWSAFSPDVASFEVLPNQTNANSVTMRAGAGILDPNVSGTIEYKFTETSGNPGATNSGWQTSRDYTDSGLSPSTSYTYRVTMRIGTGLSTSSAPTTVTTEAPNSVPPTIVSRTPLGTALNSPIRPVAVFSRPIIPRSGNVTIKNLTDNTQVAIPITDSQIVISGSTLTINPTVNLLPSKDYAIRINASAISDRQDNFFAGITNDTTWDFSTLALGATLTYSPSDGNVSINATQAAGGVITSFRFKNLEGTFVPANYTNPVGSGFGGANRTITNNLLTDTDSTNIGAGGTVNLGDIFPTNLSLNDLQNYLSARVYTGQAGSGQRLFTVVVVGNYPTASWQVDANGLWSTPSNWDPGVVDGSTANFINNITADRTVSLDSDRTLNRVVFGDSDASTAGSWILNNNGVTNNNLILSGTTPGVTVNTLGTEKSATISAVIQGTAGFVKRGSGTLILTANNTFSGNRRVNAGILHGAFPGAFGAADNSSTITISAGATLRFAASNMFGQHDSTSAPTLIVNGGIITNTGDVVNSLRNITLNSGRLDATNGNGIAYRSWALNGTITSTGTSSITDSGGDSGILLASGTPINTDLNVQSGTLDVSATLHDGRTATGSARATSLTKLGVGTMTLSASGHSYTGATNVNAGTLLIDGSTPSSSAVNVATNATLGGIGTIGHNTSIANGGGLVFQLSTPAATHNKLELAATKTMTFVGASTLTLISAVATVPGDDITEVGVSLAVPGDYTLLTAPGGFGASVPPATVILPLGWAAAAPRFVGNDLRINITSTTAILADPIANTGGPYVVSLLGSLALDGSFSVPSHLQTIVTYEWDLNNDGNYGDVTGATPAAITDAVLTSTWGMNVGLNTIGLRVTDSAAKTATSTTTVKIGTLTWDANGATATQADGPGAWFDANKWWDDIANASWTSGAAAIFGNGGAGGAVTLASPTTVDSLTFNSYITTGYTLGTAAQTITLNNGIIKNAGGVDATIISPITLGGAQTWTNNSSGLLSATGGLNNGGFLLTIGGSGNVAFHNTANIITGAGGLTKSGSGTLTLGGGGTNPAHNYTGPTIVNGGVVKFNANKTSGNMTLNGGMLTDYFQKTTEFTSGLGTDINQIQVYGDSGFGGGNGNSTWRIGAAGSELTWGSTFFNPTSLTFLTSADNMGPSIYGQASLDNGLNLNGAARTISVLAASGPDAITKSWGRINGVISGSGGSLIKAGGGNLILFSANTYDGGTTVQAGMLQISNATGLGATSGALTVNGGLLNLNNQTVSIGNLTGTGGTIANNGNAAITLTIGSGNGTGGIYQGVIANNTNAGIGTVALTKTGSGTITLAGLNTYSGATLINGGGTLVITGATQATTAVTFAANSSLGLVIGSPVTAAGAAVNLANGTVTVTGTPSAPSHVLLTALSITGTPVLASPVPGYELLVVGNQLQLNAVADPYPLWAVGGVAFNADTNGDGVKNGLAWLLGTANPSENALNKLPAASRNGAYLRLTFRCLKSTKRGTAQVKVQSSNDLGASDPWTSHEAAVPDADGTVNSVIFDTTDDGDYINVIADIPAGGTKLFGRLSGASAP